MALSKDQSELVTLCQEVSTKAGFGTLQAINGKIMMERGQPTFDRQQELKDQADQETEIALDEVIAWVRDHNPGAAQ